jgi:hypothetical protein
LTVIKNIYNVFVYINSIHTNLFIVSLNNISPSQQYNNRNMGRTRALKLDSKSTRMAQVEVTNMKRGPGGSMS